MALSKSYIIRYCLLVLTILLVPLVFLHQCQCSHYKIGPSGELGEITILRNYVIFGHHSLLFAPKSNYIKIPVEYNSSILEIEVTRDSIIHIVGCPKITSYELSKFKGMDTTTCLGLQMLHEHVVLIKCIVSTYGYGLYPTFYYCNQDSTIIRQEYLQRFPCESPDKWCYYDTIAPIP